MFRPLLLWPSSGWIQFLSEKLYREDIIQNKIFSVGKGERDLVYTKSVAVWADGKEQST